MLCITILTELKRRNISALLITTMADIIVIRHILHFWIIGFSDEAICCFNRMTNWHNLHYWLIKHSYRIQKAHTKHPRKLNAWATVYRHQVI